MILWREQYASLQWCHDFWKNNTLLWFYLLLFLFYAPNCCPFGHSQVVHGGVNEWGLPLGEYKSFTSYDTAEGRVLFLWFRSSGFWPLLWGELLNVSPSLDSFTKMRTPVTFFNCSGMWHLKIILEKVVVVFWKNILCKYQMIIKMIKTSSISSMGRNNLGWNHS